MPTTLLQVSYRPVRVGWLVRGRSRNDLREAIQLATCLWGGMFGIIVDPAGEGLEVDGALDRFRTDVLHAVSPTDAAREVVQRRTDLAWPLVGDGIVSRDRPGESGLVDLARGLTLRRPETMRRFPVLPTWEDSDEYALVYAATFGDFGHPLLGAKQRTAFLRATEAEEAPAAAVAAAFDHHEIPIDASLSGLRWVPPRFAVRDVPGVFVGSATSPSDVRAFWNTRAIWTEVVFWDSRRPDGGPFRAAIEARIQRAAAEQLDVPANFKVFPCYVSARATEHRPNLPTALRELIEAVGLGPSVTPIVRDVGIASWIHRGMRSLPAVPDERVVAHAEDRGEEESRVTIELPHTPMADRTEWIRQELAIQVETYGDFGYRGTLKLPYLPDLNAWYRWNVAGSLEHFRVHDDSFSLITSMLGPTLDVTPLKHRLLLEKLFERAGIVAKRSLPGEAARHLLVQFGGYAGIRVLRLPGVRKLLSSSRARGGIQRGAARDMINDRGRMHQADTVWLGGAQLDAAQVWEFLLHRRIFLPGIETKCRWCQHASFYRPRDIEDSLQCPKCGREFSLGPAIAGDPVRFRMSGLLEPRPDEGRREPGDDAGRQQPGAIPVLLTLLFLSEWAAGHDGQLLDTSYELTASGLQDCETDFVAVTYGATPETHTHILLGECKGRGRVTQDDVRKLGAAARRLRESGGVDCDVVFSTTRPAFTDDELSLFRRYHDDSAEYPILRRAPVLLTGADLDWGVHSQRARVSRADKFRGSGFESLVWWSTRELVGELETSTATVRDERGNASSAA